MKFLFWFVYAPLIRLLAILLYPVKTIRERVSFEKKNHQAPESESFSTQKLKAHLCFEFSSEGEYQQAASLIEDFLREGLRIEIVFFSPSVEKAMVELARRYPHQVRVLRYPLVTLSPQQSFSSWVTASVLILVRYDFFPEFLLWAQHPQHVLKILWVSLKKERGQGRFPSFYKRLFYSKAQKVFFASQAEEASGLTFGLRGEVYDFRIGQIHRRVLARSQKFAATFPLYSQLSEKIQAYPRSRRLILGNAWASDLALIQKLPEDVFCLIVPHKLERQNLDHMGQQLKACGLSYQEIHAETTTLQDHRVFILNRKGLLCELYQDFGKAYVGGGLGVSVHSLLEPLVAGSEALACGPVHHRSTEFDLAQKYGNLRVVKKPEEFQAWLTEPLKERDPRVLEAMIEQYPLMKQEVFP